MTNVGIDIVVLSSTIMVMFLPKLNKKKTNKDIFEKNKDWKLIYLIPLPLFATALVLVLCCMRYESLGYLVQKKKKEKALESLKGMWLGETRTEYKKRYRELRAKGTVKVVDFLQAAKDAKGAMAKKEAAAKKKAAKAKAKAAAAEQKIKDAQAEAEAEIKKKEEEAEAKVKAEAERIKAEAEAKAEEEKAEAEAKLKGAVMNEINKLKDDAEKDVEHAADDLKADAEAEIDKHRKPD